MPNVIQFCLVDHYSNYSYDKVLLSPFFSTILQPFLYTMKLLILVALAYGMKLLELKFMENISWWWINGLGLAAFLWFEFFERMLGLDKRKDEMLHEKMRKERLKRDFKNNKK